MMPRIPRIPGWIGIPLALLLLGTVVGMVVAAGAESEAVAVSPVPPSLPFSQPSENTKALPGVIVMAVDCKLGTLKVVEEARALSNVGSQKLWDTMADMPIIVQLGTFTTILGPKMEGPEIQGQEGPKSTCESLQPGQRGTVISTMVVGTTTSGKAVLVMKAESISIDRGVFNLQRIHEQRGSTPLKVTLKRVEQGFVVIGGGFEELRIPHHSSTQVSKNENGWVPKLWQDLIPGMEGTLFLVTRLNAEGLPKIVAGYLMINQ